MKKQEIGVIHTPKEDFAVFYCDICYQSNYPMFTWSPAADPYVDTFICFECINEIISRDGT